MGSCSGPLTLRVVKLVLLAFDGNDPAPIDFRGPLLLRAFVLRLWRRPREAIEDGGAAAESVDVVCPRVWFSLVFGHRGPDPVC